MMNWLKKLFAKLRRPPLIVFEFRHDEEKASVRVRFGVGGTENAHEYEKRMMTVILLALEYGMDKLFTDNGCKDKEMLKMSLQANILRDLLTGKADEWRREMEELRK